MTKYMPSAVAVWATLFLAAVIYFAIPIIEKVGVSSVLISVATATGIIVWLLVIAKILDIAFPSLKDSFTRSDNGSWY